MEYSGLKWSDFDFNSYPVKIQIRREITKTDAGVRKIYIYNTKLIKLLKK